MTCYALYIAQNIGSEPGPEVVFTWQGGEPMLRGLDFYRQAGALISENWLTQGHTQCAADQWCAAG